MNSRRFTRKKRFKLRAQSAWDREQILARLKARDAGQRPSQRPLWAFFNGLWIEPMRSMSPEGAEHG